ncbi:hypothetical protein JCM7447_08790 [Corynebacterium amycolatum]
MTAANPKTVRVIQIVAPVLIPATAAMACLRDLVARRRTKKTSGPGEAIPIMWTPSRLSSAVQVKTRVLG